MMLDARDDAADVADLEDEYEIVAELGRGGSAVVYRARDKSLGRDVAIKVVRGRPGGFDDEHIARLAREARTVAQLEHPLIVTVYAVKRLRDGLALVMQWVPGRTLKQTILEEGPLSPARAEQVLRDIAGALAFAHAHGVVHRDVKPENIFLDAGSGRALLSDFGIASSREFDSRLTMTGTAIGTPAYMSPEQIDGAEANARSDVYSLGLVAWEMLSGRRPWEGDSLYNVIYRQKHETLPPLDSLRPNMPERLQYLIERCLQKRPAARWAGADGLLAQLDGSVLPPDWAQWRVAQAKRVEKRRVDREARLLADANPAPAKSPGLLAAAMQTIRFRRPEPSGPNIASSATGAEAATLLPASADSTFAPPSDPRAKSITDSTADTTLDVSTADTSDVPFGAVAPVADVDAADEQPTWMQEALDDDEDDEPTRKPRGVLVAAIASLVLALAVGSWSYNAWRDSATRSLPTASRTLSDTSSVEVRFVVPPSADSIAALDSTAAAAANDTPVPGGADAYDSDAGSLGFAGDTSIAAKSTRLNGRQSPAAWPTVVHARPVGRPPPVTPPPALPSPPLLANPAPATGTTGRGTTAAEVERAEPIAFAVRATSDAGVIAAGGRHTCVLRAGKMLCWGANDDGQLGSGRYDAQLAPEPVSGDLQFTQISAGVSHSCAVTRGGEVYCWGADAAGQLGDATLISRSAPVRVASGLNFSVVRTGRDHSCALVTTGQIVCWGSNARGQLGDGTTTGRSTPVMAPTRVRFITVATGWQHSCAVAQDGMVFCWGDNSGGQLGDGTTTSHSSPSPVNSSVRFTSIAAGSAHTCAVSMAGELWCWGRNSVGAAGAASRATPTRIETGVRFASVVAGSVHSCARTVAGDAYCWGRNSYGQLGDGTNIDRVLPVHVSAPTTFSALSASGAHSCGVLTNGESVCWGYNVDGQLGDGSRTNQTRPVRVGISR